MSVLVGKPAPDFDVTAVQGVETIENFTLSQFKGKKYVLLFFYPLDFTYVWPTELHQLQLKLSEFEALNVQVVAASTDSWFSHLAWLQQPKREGGIQGIEYPIISDFNKTVSQEYDVLLPGGMALRGSFLIDKEGIVQHQSVNALPLGRNIDELLRTVRALQFCEQHGEVCPANWSSEDQGMKPTAEGVKEYFSQ